MTASRPIDCCFKWFRQLVGSTDLSCIKAYCQRSLGGVLLVYIYCVFVALNQLLEGSHL